ncbi:MAG: hypothetical protein K5798_08970 [Nitrosopumilus sp.]|uniref:Uncharacterized protein n=1 Tax=Nitrosopumilus zosterae TaxID=718286 RepID=A0A2S2KQD6_9ARCH|nr:MULTISPECIES: hypothetical protein [Nitrosopumilus]MCV0367374.1 hypothetical protein [Nitrosopumilus sp.]BDQ31560.1 hypothetical protein NZOSNM25_001681 [Nitrosopumilus zosterae]GBH33767.1 hypothetical protein NZNM25_05580 [Nitrosopumilus zosterae]
MRVYLGGTKPKRAGYSDNQKDRASTRGLQLLHSQHYQNANKQKTMKSQKEIHEFKKELIKTLRSGDSPYFGLSLESLVNN